MKIEFEKNIAGFQEARKLRMILEHYAHSNATDKPARLLIESIIEQIDTFISEPEFKSLARDAGTEDAADSFNEEPDTFLNPVMAGLRALFGPSKKEMLLSRQRQELLERAERAEAMAFDALAEKAEIGRERDAMARKLKRADEGQG